MEQTVDGHAIEYLIEQIFTRLERRLDPSHTLGIATTECEQEYEEEEEED